MCIENKKKTSFQWLRWSASRKSWKCAMLPSWWLDEKRVPALLLNILLLYCCCYGAFSWMKRQANRSNREKKVHTISLYRNFRTLQSICSVCWVELSLGYEIVVVFFSSFFFCCWLLCLSFFRSFCHSSSACWYAATTLFPNDMHDIRYLVWFGFYSQKVEFRTTTSIPAINMH